MARFFGGGGKATLKLTFLGIEIDTDALVLCLLEEKLTATRGMGCPCCAPQSWPGLIMSSIQMPKVPWVVGPFGVLSG